MHMDNTKMLEAKKDNNKNKQLSVTDIQTVPFKKQVTISRTAQDRGLLLLYSIILSRGKTVLVAN